MDKRKGWLWATAMAAVLASAAPAGAATVTVTFHVSAVVVGTCRIIPGQAQGCAPSATPASSIPAPQPLVRFSRDAKTGATIQTVEF